MPDLTNGDNLFNPVDDANLQTQINEFNHALRILEKPSVSINVIRRTVARIEARLISIITQVSAKAVDHPEGLDPYALWLVANRREIVANMDTFNLIRSRAAFPRDQQGRRQLATSYDEVREHFRDVTKLYGNFTNDLRVATSKYYVAVAGASAVTATGLSAFSFLAPPIGMIVTPTVAGAGLIGTGVAAYYGDKEGERKGPSVAEDAIRARFNNQIP